MVIAPRLSTGVEAELAVSANVSASVIPRVRPSCTSLSAADRVMSCEGPPGEKTCAHVEPGLTSGASFGSRGPPTSMNTRLALVAVALASLAVTGTTAARVRGDARIVVAYARSEGSAAQALEGQLGAR